MDWIAIGAVMLVVFILGMACGIWLLSVNLRHNGWRLYLHVEDNK